jgi:hypothetical protein
MAAAGRIGSISALAEVLAHGIGDWADFAHGALELLACTLMRERSCWPRLLRLSDMRISFA